MKKQLISFILLLFSTYAFAQADLSSPYETLYTHLHNLQDESYNPKIAAKSINPNLLQGEDAIEAAIKLKEILDGKGLFIYLNHVPDRDNYTDTINSKHQYILSLSEPLIYLEKVNDKWYYSEETISNISKLYNEVYPFGTRVFNKILPPSIGNKTFLFFKFWQWLGILILIVVGFFIHKISDLLFSLLVSFLDRRNIVKGNERNKKLNDFLKTLGLFLIVVAISLLTPSLRFEPKLSSLVIKGLNILLIFIAAIAVRRLIFFGLDYFKSFAQKTESKLDDQLLPVVGALLNILIGIIAFSLALKQLNVNLTAIIAGLSIGGLALALASQDTVKNFIGSITIFLDHPFEIGDYIIISGTEGTVEKVGMRATRIKTPNQSVAYIPNGDLSNMIIDNYGLRAYRRWNLTLGLEYGTSTAKISEFCDRLTVVLEELDFVADNLSLVKLTSMGDFSINIFAMIFLDINTYNKELGVKHDILLKVIDLAEEVGVSFAFPTQTLHLQNNGKNT